MSVALKVRDETTSGEITLEFELRVLSEQITVRDLIKQRVYEEVDKKEEELSDRQTPAVYQVYERSLINTKGGVNHEEVAV